MKTANSYQGPTLVIEKNVRKGDEISSRNSEVIHAGIYYPNDSLKTQLCIRGRQLMYKICQTYHIPFQKIGKWIIGNGDEDGEYLTKLKKKCDELENVPISFLSDREIKIKEPHVRASVGLASLETGIVDSFQVMEFYEHIIQRNDGIIALQSKLKSVEKPENGLYQCEIVHSNSPSNSTLIEAKFVINCAGLLSDEVSKIIMGDSSGYKLHYCKGYYYRMNGSKIVSRLIYPTPEKNLSGLGIHTTLDLSGSIRFGPDVEYVDDPYDYLFDKPNDHRMKFIESLKRYLPQVDFQKMSKDYSGIRPKLAGPGEPFRDFIIQEESQKGFPGVVNLVGIESPGLTAAPAIAQEVAKKLGFQVKEDDIQYKS